MAKSRAAYTYVKKSVFTAALLALGVAQITETAGQEPAPEAPAAAPDAPVALEASLPAVLPAPVSTDPYDVPSVRLPLRKALDTRVSGLDQLNATKEQQTRLWKRTRMLVDFRRGRLSIEDTAELFADCIVRSALTPQCDFLAEGWQQEWGRPGRSLMAGIPLLGPSDESEEKESGDSPGVPRPSRDEVVGALQEADFSVLKRATSGTLYRALDQFATWEPLRKAATEVLDRRDCATTDLVTALGQKAEEYFPDPNAVQTAVSLFSVVDRCAGKQARSAANARYRLALIHQWQGDCLKSEPVWEKLAVDPSGQYISRANYWLGRCAEERGDTLRVEALRSRILKENPLGFHAISAHGGIAPPIRSMVFSNEPEVQLRSAAAPEFNRVVLVIEALQASQADGIATELIQFLRDRATETEPEFRLYLAVLALRSGDRITQFQLLSSLFKSAPHLLSEQTLKLFYPLKRYPTLWQYAGWVNPFLSLALIRQESAFNESATSGAGAVGLMQLMPDTARRVAGVSRTQLMRPMTNLKIGVKFFKELLERYKGDAELALAAYNAGSEKVDGWLRRYPTEDRMLFLDFIPYSETRNYVALIARNYLWYLTLYAPETLEPKQSRRLASAKAAPKNSVVFRALNRL